MWRTHPQGAGVDVCGAPSGCETGGIRPARPLTLTVLRDRTTRAPVFPAASGTRRSSAAWQAAVQLSGWRGFPALRLSEGSACQVPGLRCRRASWGKCRRAWRKDGKGCRLAWRGTRGLDLRQNDQIGAVTISGDFTGRPQAPSGRRPPDQAEIAMLSLERPGALPLSRKLVEPRAMTGEHRPRPDSAPDRPKDPRGRGYRP